MKVLVFSALCAAGLALAAPASAQMMAADLKVGDPAPNFKLEASDGKTYELADFKGKQAVVLAWFPAAFSAGCTIECKSLSEHGDMIEKYNVTYFMASVDSIEGEKGNKAFAAAHNAHFPLLGDPTKVNRKGLRRAERARIRESLDVLHRQGRPHHVHRQGRELAPGDLCRGHGDQAW